MNLRRDLPLILFITALAGTLAWFVWKPYATAKQLQAAAGARDAATLSQHIDYDALRPNLRAEITTLVNAEINREGQTAMGALSAALAGIFIEPMVDLFVTPEALASLMAGSPPATGGEQAEREGEAAPAPDAHDIAMGYEDLNTFTIRVTPRATADAGADADAAGDSATAGSAEPPAIVFVLSRHDWKTWKLTGIRLPREAMMFPADDSGEDATATEDAFGGDDGALPEDGSAAYADGSSDAAACVDAQVAAWRDANGMDADIPAEYVEAWYAACGQ